MNNKSLAAVIASISLSKTTGLKTVAESLETQVQADLLTQMSCDYLQGYFYSKPLAPQKFKRFISSYYCYEIVLLYQ